MADGWISLHRRFLEWEWYDDNNTKSLYIHCLLKANSSPKNWRGIDIKRGQFFTSISNMSSELNLSYKQVRNSIEKLTSTGEIKTEGASNGTKVTVCKYDTYQDNTKSKGKQTGERGANIGQTEGERGATTNKHNNNNNKDNKDKVKYAEFVSMLKSEYEKLVSDYGKVNTDKMITTLDNYKGANNKQYKSDYRAVLSWVADKVGCSKNGQTTLIAKSPKPFEGY